MDSTPAPSINWSSLNLKSEWRKFKRHCELMFSGPLSGKSGRSEMLILNDLDRRKRTGCVLNLDLN